HAHAAELAPPQVVRRLAEAVLAAQLLDRQSGLGLAQEADDLLFGKALLHVQSPRFGELDSRSPCYSKPGGRRGCHTRQLLGWQLSRSGRATTAAAALEQALITR